MPAQVSPIFPHTVTLDRSQLGPQARVTRENFHNFTSTYLIFINLVIFDVFGLNYLIWDFGSNSIHLAENTKFELYFSPMLLFLQI